MRRTLAATLLMIVLAACAPAAVSNGPTPIPVITPPTPAPTIVTRTPADTAPPPSPPPAGPPPAAPATTVISRSFPLAGVGGNVSGVVTVTQRDGRFVATVSAHGLSTRMATLHTVHIHLGSCANPYGGMHATVLGLLSASAAGAGTLTAPIAPVYLSSGHYLILYATTAPQVIVGCATLGPVS